MVTWPGSFYRGGAEGKNWGWIPFRIRSPATQLDGTCTTKSMTPFLHCQFHSTAVLLGDTHVLQFFDLLGAYLYLTMQPLFPH